MYRTFVEPFFLYCLPIWGHTTIHETDILRKMQNKTLRILFECKRTDDAWLATDNKILRLDKLFDHEVVKFCFNHHTNKLPAYILPRNSNA